MSANQIAILLLSAVVVILSTWLYDRSLLTKRLKIIISLQKEIHHPQNDFDMFILLELSIKLINEHGDDIIKLFKNKFLTVVNDEQLKEFGEFVYYAPEDEGQTDLLKKYLCRAVMETPRETLDWIISYVNIAENTGRASRIIETNDYSDNQNNGEIIEARDFIKECLADN